MTIINNLNQAPFWKIKNYIIYNIIITSKAWTKNWFQLDTSIQGFFIW